MNVFEWKKALAPLPYVAILRGLQPENTQAVIGELCESDFRAVEIPFNSPDPLKSIEIAVREFGGNILVGGGTVLNSGDVKRVYDAGAQFVVSPNADQSVIETTKALDMVSIPGVSTPTEAFSALQAGADILKLFPAENLPPLVVKSWRAVLPKELWLLPVGGITPEQISPYVIAGADGFGLGSSLFRPEHSSKEVGESARLFVSAYKSLSA